MSAQSDPPAAPVERVIPPEAGPEAVDHDPATPARQVAGDVADDTDWHRLSWRMLLVDPLGSLTRLAPLFLVSLWLGSHRSNYWFELTIIGIVVVVALLRWLSTSYTIGPTHIVLRKGFFNRQVVTVARNRVRSVDTESDLFHRVLRVSIVEVGTGQADSGKQNAGRFRLDAIDTADVEPLRDELLAHLRRIDPSLRAEDEVQWGSRFGEDIALWKVTWARFAPLSMIGFGVLFSLWLLTWQMGDMHQRIMELGVVTGTTAWLDSLGRPWNMLGRAIAVWMIAGVLAVVTYAIRYGKYALTDHGKALYVQNGVLRRKHQALDTDRLRGVEIRVPIFLRLAGGGRLEPIMTGTKRSGSTGSTLLPQAPIGDVRRVAARILGSATPVTVPLRRHPWRAARRRVVRGLFPFWFVLALALLLRWDLGPSVDVWLRWGLPAALVVFLTLAADRVRMLGHRLLPGFLVTAHGSWAAKRTVLETDGIIGWTVSQSVFQRRAGLANVTAATPAGNGAYSVVDMAAEEAWPLAEALTPGITDVWGVWDVDPADCCGRRGSSSPSTGVVPPIGPGARTQDGPQQHPPQR